MHRVVLGHCSFVFAGVKNYEGSVVELKLDVSWSVWGGKRRSTMIQKKHEDLPQALQEARRSGVCVSMRGGDTVHKKMASTRFAWT